MKKLILLLFMVMISNQTCMADVLYGRSDFDIGSSLAALEDQIYNKSYADDELKIRVERLENTLLGKVQNGTIEERLKILSKTAIKSGNIIERNNMVFLEMIEQRYLGASFPADTFEDRLSRLELAILGKIQNGNIKERFENLTKKIPVNIVGIQIIELSGARVDIKPEIKEKEIVYSGAKLTYSSQSGDYFDNISRYKDEKILRWRDIPVLLYIPPSLDKKISESVENAINIWNKYIPIVLTSSMQDANIIIRQDLSTIITEPALSFYKNKISYKVIIHSGGLNPAENSFNDRFFTHQLGHAVGIWGHSDDPSDIMYNFKEIKDDIRTSSDCIVKSSLFSQVSHPSLQDINTLYKIYKTPSAIENYLEH